MSRKFNLTLAAKRLGQTEHKFRSAVAVYDSYTSILTDLRAAERALGRMGEIRRGTPEDMNTLGQAVMCFAVMMYCRAVDPGGSRKGPGIERKYSEENRKRHKDIDDFRNATIAHLDVGRGPHGEGWIQEFVILNLDEETGLPDVTNVHNRLNATWNLEIDLLSLVIAAIEIMKIKIDEKKKVLLEAWNEAGEAVRGVVFDCKFDWNEFFAAAPSAPTKGGYGVPFDAPYSTFGWSGPMSKEVAKRMFPELRDMPELKDD